MTAGTLSRLVDPSHWATPPTTLSFSELQIIDACPLQWQLIHSAYSDMLYFPARPHPAAVEVEIAHVVLDLLFKNLALAGLPAIDSPAFRAQIANINVQRVVEEHIAACDARMAAHPRGGGLRLRLG